MIDVITNRVAAIATTVASIRAIEREQGVTRAALERIEKELIALAARTELFPPEHFPVAKGKTGEVFRLSEDGDFRFALYASAGAPGKFQPPHNHTTWAAIAGVYGDEHNVFYERTDNRGVPGRGTLRKTGERTVRRGNACSFLPDDFHTIAVSDSAALHLHMYGRSLEELPERIAFESDAGGGYAVFPANPGIAPPVLEATSLKAMLRAGRELALFDVREEGIFAEGHLLFANSLPLSRLEMLIDAQVPRRDTLIVVMDGGEGELVRRAARRLNHLGYGNVMMLAGGLAGWRTQGFEVFSGVNVPSKAFGEFIEHHENTPRREPAEIKAMIDSGRKLVILDSRPFEEFHAMSIPGGIDCPGAELVHRVFELVPDSSTTIVVNCAGRTRSIIGAQSLINAGVPNEIIALKNGTMGWHLAGLELARGETARAREPSPESRRRGREAAERVAERFAVPRIDHEKLAAFGRDARTLFRFDVRDPAEYAAGHLPGFRSAPGGQLVQATDRYVGVRGARIVLACDNLTRSLMTASWLIQLGWDAHVLENALDGARLELGAERVIVPGLGDTCAEFIQPAELEARRARDALLVIDLDTSLRYRAGHIPGAWWAIRERLTTAAKTFPASQLAVLTSRDGVLAQLAAREATQALGREVRVLRGGTAAWTSSGLPLETGDTQRADEPIDVWYRPYDRTAGVEDAMKAYLTWEVDLVAQVNRDGDARFRL